MAVSTNSKSKKINIEKLDVNNVVVNIANVHYISLTNNFNANITNVESDIEIKLNEVLLTNLPNNQAITTITQYSTSIFPNTNNLVITYKGNEIHNQSININQVEILFNDEVLDFGNQISFTMNNYVADANDRVNFYSKGLSSKKGIKKAFDNYNTDNSNSTPDLIFVTTLLNPFIYNVKKDTIIMEVEKVGIDNSLFQFTNSSETQSMIIYMNEDFDENMITYGSEYTVEYQMFVPIWKDILTGDNILPSVTFTGDVKITNKDVSYINEGIITINITYLIDDAWNVSLGKPTTVGTYTYETDVKIKLEDFELTKTLNFQSQKI